MLKRWAVPFFVAVTAATVVPQANAITATATGADGTSEFSDPVAVVPAS
jgi:hypothetical protein